MGTVTRKGQVTIPKKVRDYLGIKTGTTLDFELAPDGRVVVVKRSGKQQEAASKFARIRGTATVKLTTDEIMSLTRGSRRK